MTEMVNMVLKVKELKECIKVMLDDLVKQNKGILQFMVVPIRNWDVDQFEKLKVNFLIPREMAPDIKNIYDKAEAEVKGSGPFAVVHGVHDDENILITTADGVCLVLMNMVDNSFLVLETKLKDSETEMCIRAMPESEVKNYVQCTFFAKIQQEWIDRDAKLYLHFKKLVQRHDSAIKAIEDGFMSGNARMS